MRFHILGLGPIGSLLAHNLNRAIPRKPEVFLIHKNQQQAAQKQLRGNSIRVDTLGVRTTSTGFRSEVFEGPELTPSEPESDTVASPPPPGNIIEPDNSLFIQSLFVTAKAQHTLRAIQRLHPRLSPISTIVLLQNGMGMYEELVTHVFPNPSLRPHFILATNTHGAYTSHDAIVHSGIGAIEFGIMPEDEGRNFEASAESPENFGNLSINDITKPGDPEYERYKYLRSTVAALQLLEDLNVSWKPMSYIQLAMRRKLVVNAVINPLTALLRCENGALLQQPQEFERITSQVCQEASNVFAAQIEAEAREGIQTEEYARLPAMLMPQNLVQEVLRVAKMTKANKSSMLSDIERAREPEIDYINGYIMRLGQMYNIPTPTTASLYHLVKMRTALPLDRWL